MSDDLRRLEDPYSDSYPSFIWMDAPTLVSLVPSTAVVGQPVTVTVNGGGFLPTSVVRADGAPLPTTYVSATALTVSGTPLTSGSALITVANGSAISNALTFTVTTVEGLAVEKRGRGRALVHWAEHQKPEPAQEPAEPEPEEEPADDELDSDEPESDHE